MVQKTLYIFFRGNFVIFRAEKLKTVKKKITVVGLWKSIWQSGRENNFPAVFFSRVFFLGCSLGGFSSSRAFAFFSTFFSSCGAEENYDPAQIYAKGFYSRVSRQNIASRRIQMKSSAPQLLWKQGRQIQIWVWKAGNGQLGSVGLWSSTSSCVLNGGSDWRALRSNKQCKREEELKPYP